MLVRSWEYRTLKALKKTMTIKLVMKHHKLTGGMVIEVFDDDVFVACVYPHEDGIRVVSKYLGTVRRDDDNPPSLTIHFE